MKKKKPRHLVSDRVLTLLVYFVCKCTYFFQIFDIFYEKIIIFRLFNMLFLIFANNDKSVFLINSLK
jgi:hypothetical protein